MKPADQRLVRRLASVLVIKLAVLIGLWAGFVRDQQVAVDASGMAAQVLVQGSVSNKEDNK
ncbi:cytochrome oxidase putative small subunit CydP [Rhodoferax sp.]|jgi:hypothetical protein|uniref:cytochrome oxidase putative small subunit CydP n=1 Tax=Rhodoferax sp. TaxID=50421 RepID=UPI0027184705|nr:cytochrome oxidase putative small subunit CydP [Rhodoferax sp.]MDO9143381.1 hypothetical protein [Rhodoferax sp.]MDP1529170.1 hypothetical protein [Rhodoferax sp.]MDP1944003.1 hypothetical protein [Rhodoferax sp.]MDP2441638.1 hypothetical protein [Rhodoferax sp.]MDP3190546.1 hypothetical protein [Rhodoferax sp.]